MNHHQSSNHWAVSETDTRTRNIARTRVSVALAGGRREDDEDGRRAGGAARSGKCADRPCNAGPACDDKNNK